MKRAQILSKRLHELRNKNNLTQFALAKSIKVSQSTIAKWENGDRFPKIEELVDLCIFFNVSLDFMVGIEKIKAR